MTDERNVGTWLERWEALRRGDEDLEIGLDSCEDVSPEELCRELRRWGEAVTERLRVQDRLLEAALEALGLHDRGGPPPTAENPDPPPKPPFKK